MITMSERAADAVRKMRDELGLAEEMVLRVGVVGGGCSGFSYDIKFSTPKEKDKVVETHGMRVAIDPKSLLYIAGTELDWEDTLMHRGFTFQNPNAAKTCGCGTSFSVK